MGVGFMIRRQKREKSSEECAASEGEKRMDVDFEDTVTGAAFSIGLADDPTANEVIIQPFSSPPLTLHTPRSFSLSFVAGS